MVVAAGAQAAKAEPEYDIDLPAQDVASALEQLATQTGAITLFPYDLAEVRTANAVVGRYTLPDALDLLLKDTGLSGDLSEKRVISISAVAAAERTNEEEPMKLKRTGIWGALLGVLSGSTALAQDSPPQQSGASAGLEEIIVTSRRRDESLQQTPISVTARTGEQLEAFGVRNMIEMGNFTPNVMTLGSGIGPSVGAYYLRGIGSGRSGIDDEPPVGLYLDGVFLGSFDGSLLQVIKPKRVEVLRGPQGTLFGKNALGGAVQYISQEPIIGESNGEIEATFGSYQRTDVTAYFNIPVNDTMAMRLTGASFNRDGVVTRPGLPDVNDIGTNYLRADFLWDATDDLSVRIAADLSTVDTNGAGNVADGFDVTDRRAAQMLAAGFDIRDGFTGDPYSNRSTSPTYVDAEQTGLSVTVDWLLGNDWSFRSITAFRQNDQDTWIDRDAGPYRHFEQVDSRRHEQVTEELQFSYATDRLDWIIGLYYFDESPFNNRQRYEQLETGNGILHEIFEESNQSTAIYSEATYQFTDRFSLSMGARFTYEDKHTSTISFREGSGDDPLTPSNSADFDAFSPRVVAQMQWTPDVMTYLSIGDGFKSGGFNTRYNPTLPANGFIPYDEETLENYEIGVRTEVLDNRLRFNASVFHSIYQDRQITQLTDLDTLLITNGGEAEFDGLEIEGLFQATRNLSLDFGIGHVKSKITDIGRATNLQVGEPVGSTPEWSYNLALAYSHSQISYRLAYGWKDGRYLGPEGDSRLQPSYGLLTARIEYRHPSEQWKISFFGTNLTDEEFLVQQQSSRGVDMAVYSDPREFGVSAAFTF